MMARASRESRRTRALEDKSAVDIENDHTSSAHLDTRTSNPSNSERFDGQADSRDGLEAFKDDRFQEGDRQTLLVHDSKEGANRFGERSSGSMKRSECSSSGLVVLVVGVMLCDGQQGTEATAWHKAAGVEPAVGRGSGGSYPISDKIHAGNCLGDLRASSRDSLSRAVEYHSGRALAVYSSGI